MSNKYDKIIKENIEAMYLSLSEKVLNFRPELVEDVVVDLHRTIERSPDFLKKVKESQLKPSFLLHIEIQTKDDSEMLYRMNEYHALLLRKFKKKIVQIVIYLGKGRSKMIDSYDDGFNRYSFHLINIQDFSYKTFLVSDRPEELLLTILSDFENEQPEFIFNLLLTRAKIITNETFTLDKFVTQMTVLSKIRNLEIIFKKLQKF